jgi:ligand-binding sensor domain-containing protein
MRMNKSTFFKKALFYTCAFLSSATVLAQNWTNYFSNPFMDVITVDKQNHKWFGTSNGVWHFDGSHYTHYHTSNSGLAGNQILAIAIDSQNNKWIATKQDGISKFDGTHWKTFNTTNSGLTCNEVHRIAIDAQGNKWFGNAYNGISKFDDRVWTTYDSIMISNR